jgi:hypothetical protein
MRVGQIVVITAWMVLACTFSAFAFAYIPQQTCPEASPRSIPMLFAPCQAYGAVQDGAKMRQALGKFKEETSKLLVASAL